MSRIYDFDEQYDIGKHGENEVFEILDQRGFKVEPVKDIILQAKGIDAFIHKDFQSYSIEIKTDLTAVHTDNAFLEVALERAGVADEPGYVYKTCAQLLVYYLPGKNIYAFDMLKIRKFLNSTETFVFKKAANQTYTGKGIVIPLYRLYSNCGVWQWQS